MIVKTRALLFLHKDLCFRLGLTSPGGHLAGEEEIVFVCCDGGRLAHIFDFIRLERLVSNERLREGFVDTAVAVQVTIVGPVEVLVLNRNRGHVDGRTTELTLVQRIADKIDRILLKQEQVSVDLPDRAFVRDIHIE